MRRESRFDWNMKQLAATKPRYRRSGARKCLDGVRASIPIVADFKRTLGLDTGWWD